VQSAVSGKAKAKASYGCMIIRWCNRRCSVRFRSIQYWRKVCKPAGNEAHSDDVPGRRGQPARQMLDQICYFAKSWKICFSPVT